ncbi:SAM-dependent methyltransferase [Pyrobaculum ferrireducens]|uniref:uroporphyrinogen-III C-methyltransferase n=1 Tax=Pyrobaculum ferrireducens TaxID=1104324 RepID=G7VI86_9CREN|nr:SAM-dependent methyltransferase [Pyrobaculum ferrireducens]AET32178.1 uroporphyrin-III C-methyltransferase [Pyrobaculum ferrireducens]
MVLGKVFVVGAGPGDPDLITLKGFFLLLTADVVVAGSLVPDQLLDVVKDKVIYRERLTKERHEEAVEAALRAAREGKTVVFLKNGDPVLYGRGLEICRRAEEEGIPCEIVPGVTSVTAAAAKYKIPIGESGRPILLKTGRSDGAEPDVVVLMPEDAAEGLVVENLYGPGEKIYQGRPRGRPAIVFSLSRELH